MLGDDVFVEEIRRCRKLLSLRIGGDVEQGKNLKR